MADAAKSAKHPAPCVEFNDGRSVVGEAPGSSEASEARGAPRREALSGGRGGIGQRWADPTQDLITEQ